MAGIGLEAAGGLSAVQALLRQRFEDQLAERAFNRRSQVEDRNFDLQTKQFQSGEELKKAQLDATIANRGMQQQEHQATAAGHLADTIPGDTFVPNQDPAVKTMQTGGYGSLLTPQDATQPMGPDFVGPMPNGETPQQAQVGRPQGFLKVRSAKQADTETDNQRQAAKDAAGAQERAAELIRQQARDAETGRHNRAEENKPGAAGHFTLQPEIDPKTGAPTGRFFGYDTKTNSFHIVAGVTPAATKAAPGAAQTATETRTKSEALDTLAQLDQAIENAKSMIGPGEGRISNLEQMAGNADPRIQALGVKMKAAKMRVDHAITGSVRAGASPVLLQQWDNILANKITPEGLKGGVQAMREIIGGGSGGGTIRARDAQGVLHEAPAGTTLPTGWKLEP